MALSLSQSVIMAPNEGHVNSSQLCFRCDATRPVQPPVIDYILMFDEQQTYPCRIFVCGVICCVTSLTLKPPITGNPLNPPEINFYYQNDPKSHLLGRSTRLGIFRGEQIFCGALAGLEGPEVGDCSCWELEIGCR